jgi:hypothetical protein
MSTLERSPPPHLERLQKLFIKLLFCEPTRAAYCQSPRQVLSQYDLSPDYQKSLPDPNSEKFKVEAHGRRMRVFRETFGQFPKTIEMLDKNLAETDGAGPVGGGGPDFNTFLSSDAFTDPAWGLPAPDGSGPGYENVSKFYFWIRDVCGLSQPNAPIPLRTTANSEFAVHLINVSKTRSDPFYAQFSNGVTWRENPGASPPWYVVTDQLQFGRIISPPAFIPYGGWPDMDALSPAGASTTPNIR